MPALFLHGFLGHPTDWDGVRKELPFESVALTLPGHLDQPLYKDLVEQLHLQIASAPLLVGYSAGGRLALALKERYPQSYGKVVVFSAHPGLKQGRKERFEKDLRWAHQFRNLSLKEALKKWYQQPLFEGFSIPWEKRLCHNPEHLAFFLEHFSLGTQPIPKLYPDSYFVHGARDLKYKTLYLTLPKTIPVIALAYAGHAVHLENPDGCTKILRGIYEHHSVSTKQLERNTKI